MRVLRDIDADRDASLKTVEMVRDYLYRPTRHFMTAFKAGHTYTRVPEFAVMKIVEAGAGRVVSDSGEAIANGRTGRRRTEVD